MSELFDMDAYNEAKAMMKNKFATIIDYFLEDAADYIASIKAGIGANDIHSVVTASHTLKSSSRQIGAARLSAIAAEIEANGRNNSDSNLIHHLLPKIEAAFAETNTALRNM